MLELTSSRTPTGLPTGLDIAAINPVRSDKFSPNLYRYLNKRGHADQLLYARVYKGKAGDQWLGFLDTRGFFIGNHLIRVLCAGVKQQLGDYPVTFTGPLKEVRGFWKHYQRFGRCAVDPAHQMCFVSNHARWRVDGNERACNWCGQVQREHTWQDVVDKSQWLNIELPAPTPKRSVYEAFMAIATNRPD